MAYLDPIQRTAVWNSLDPVLRAKVEKGELTLAEAAEFVIPLGDLQLANARASGPGRSPGAIDYGVEQPAPRGLDSVSVPVEQAKETDITGLAGAGTQDNPLNIPAWSPLSEDDLFARAPIGSYYRGLDGQVQRRDYQPIADTARNLPLRMGQIALNAGKLIADVESALLDPTKTMGAAAVLDPAGGQLGSASAMAGRGLRAPETTWQDVKDAEGIADTVGTAGTFIAGQTAYSAPDMLAAMLLPVYMSARTQEIGTSRAENDARAKAEVMDYVKALPAAAIESLLERFTTKALFTGGAAETVAGRIAQQTAVQGAGGGIEELAAYTGETLGTQRGFDPNEALDTFLAGALVESGMGGTIESGKEALRTLRGAKPADPAPLANEFAAQLAEIKMDNAARANRERFDAELEADRAIKDLKDAEALARGEQLELPIGSGYGGNISPTNADGTPTPGDVPTTGRRVPENDRTPTIADMFTGEQVAATKAEERRAGNVAEAERLAAGERTLTEDEFELQSQRTSDAKRTIDERQQVAFEEQKRRELNDRQAAEQRAQDEFEAAKQKEADERRQLAEDQTVLKNERRLLSSTDINREARELVAREQEGIRKQRAGIANTPERMKAVLENYARKRLPELVGIVRNRRLAQVNAAREREIARENAKLEAVPQEQIDRQNAGRAADKFAAMPRGFSTTPTAISPGFRVENLGAPMTDLLPESQAGALGRVTSTGRVVDGNEQFTAEPNPNPVVDTRPRGTQGTLTLPTAEQGDLFAGGGQFTGEMTPEQMRAELEAGQRRRREQAANKAKAATEQATAQQAVTAEEQAAIDAELAAAQETTAKEEGRRSTVTAATYKRKETEARNKFAKEELDNKGTRTKEEIDRAVATKMAAWRKDNPRPAEATVAATPATPLAERAKTIAERQESAKKAAETKKVDKALARELKKGATPEEAAQVVADRQMTKAEDAAQRKALETDDLGEDYDQVESATPEGTPFVESKHMRDALNKEMGETRPSIARLLEAILTAPEATRGEKWLAAKLAPLVRASGVRLLPAPDGSEILNRALGAYSRVDNTMWIQAASISTILHESLHAVTSNLLSSSQLRTNPIVRRAYEQLEQAMQVANMAIADGSVKLEGITERRWSQATANVREFLAHGLTEDAFIALLGKIEMPGPKKNVWSAFKDAIKSIFRPSNPEQNTVLDAIIEATSDLTDEVTAGDRFKANLEVRSLGEQMRTRTAAEMSQLGSVSKSRRNFLLGMVAAGGMGAAGVRLTASDTTTLGRASTQNDSVFNQPLSDNAVDALRSGNSDTLRDVLTSLRGSVPEDVALMAEELAVLLPSSGIRTRTKFGQWNAAGSVSLDPESDVPYTLTLYVDSGGNDVGTLLHEVYHIAVATRYGSLSLGLVDSNWDVLGIPNPSPEAMSKFRALFREFSKWSSRAEVRQEAAKLDEVSQIAIREAASNPDEFFVRTLTDPNLRRFMANSRYDGRSLITKFKDWVKSSLFGDVSGTRASWLDAALEASSYITTAMKSAPADNRFMQSSRSMEYNRLLDEMSQVDDTTATPLNKSFTVNGKVRPEWKTKFFEAVMDTFTAGGGAIDPAKGVRAAITEIFERSAGETGALIHRAEQLFKEMDFNLEKQAVLSNQNIDTYRTQFNKDIEAFENMADRNTKAIRAKELRSKYGAAADAYFRSRSTIDSMSREILQQRLADPRPFTVAEAKIYNSIKENIGRYYTRVYAANTRGIGEKRAKKLWREFEKVLKGSSKAAFQDGFKIVNDAIRYVANNQLLIPDNTDMEDMSVRELQEFAKAWGLTLRGEADFDNVMDTEQRKEALIEQLREFAEATPQARMNRAQQLVKDLLFASQNSPLANYYRNSETDRTIVSDRKVVPEEIRKLLGEYDDTPLKAMTTIIRMASFRSRTKAFNELIASQGGVTVLTQKEFSERNLDPTEWIRMTNDGAGPIQGMYVRKDIAERIESTIEITRTFDQVVAAGESGVADAAMKVLDATGRGWMKFAGMMKGLQLMWNVMNAAWNWLSGGWAMLHNGNLSPTSVVKAHKIAAGLIRSQNTYVNDPDIERVIRSGITDSALLGAIRKVEAEKLDQVLFSNLRSPLERRASRAGAKFGDATRAWKETYAMADVVWKIANFLDQEQKIKDVFDAEGKTYTPEDVERLAAWRTNMSNFSYKRVPNVIKMIEKGGISYVAPYVYETFRAPVGSVLVGLTDIIASTSATTPKAKALLLKNGSQRLVGAVLAMGLAQQAAYGLMHMINDSMSGEDDEEYAKKLKAILADYKQKGNFMYLGKNEDGEPVLIEMSRVDPFGPSTEFIRLAMEGGEAKDYIDAVKNLFIQNPHAVSILESIVGSGSTNTRWMEDTFPGAYDTLVSSIRATQENMLGSEVIDSQRAVRVLDRMMPSMPAAWMDPNNKAVEGDLFANAVVAMGGRLENVDVNRSVQFATMKYDAKRTQARDQLYEVLKTGYNLDDRELMSRLSEAYGKEREAVEDLSTFYSGMLELGYTPQQTLGTIKQVGGLSDQELYNMAAGYSPYASSLLSEQGIMNSLKSMKDRGAPINRQEKYLANVQRLARLIQEGKFIIEE